METKIITKAGSVQRVEITLYNNGTRYQAGLMSGYGWELTFIRGCSFKTLKGAERWAAKKLA